MKTVKKILAGIGYYFILIVVLPMAVEVYIVWKVVSAFLDNAARHVPQEHYVHLVSPGAEKLILVVAGTHILHHHRVKLHKHITSKLSR